MEDIPWTDIPSVGSRDIPCSLLSVNLNVTCPFFVADRWHVAGRQRHHVSVYGHHPAGSRRTWRTDLQGRCPTHHPGRCAQGAPQQDRGTHRHTHTHTQTHTSYKRLQHTFSLLYVFNNVVSFTPRVCSMTTLTCWPAWWRPSPPKESSETWCSSQTTMTWSRTSLSTWSTSRWEHTSDSSLCLLNLLPSTDTDASLCV